jgi:hypothetical protein
MTTVKTGKRKTPGTKANAKAAVSEFVSSRTPKYPAAKPTR